MPYYNHSINNRNEPVNIIFLKQGAGRLEHERKRGKTMLAEIEKDSNSSLIIPLYSEYGDRTGCYVVNVKESLDVSVHQIKRIIRQIEKGTTVTGNVEYFLLTYYRRACYEWAWIRKAVNGYKALYQINHKMLVIKKEIRRILQ